MSARARVAIVAVAALLGAFVTMLVVDQRTSGTPSVQATDSFPTPPEPSPSSERRDPRLPSEPLSTFSADIDDNLSQQGSPPTQLSVPAIDVSLPIRPRGVDKDGAMSLPETVNELSWYKFGAAPEDPGATVVAGHVDTKTEGKGPLANLAGLKRGDRLDLKVANRSVAYRVEAVRQVSKSLIDLDSLFSREGPRRLHIVTCAGAYDPDRGGYQANLVVVARPVG